jgi:hypothetical protein
MMVSAELRWFWKDAPPPDISDWFHSGDVPAGGGCELRRDRYFPHRREPELGVKIREGRGEAQVEIKGLVAIRPPRGLRGLDLDVRRVEIWCKWRTAVTPAGAGLAVDKLRWLRRFAVSVADGVEEIPLRADEQPEPWRAPPAAGCNVELTKIVLPEQGDTWWTLGFEAFGGLDRVCGVLARTLRTRRPPRANPETELSYPAWLKKHYDY